MTTTWSTRPPVTVTDRDQLLALPYCSHQNPQHHSQQKPPVSEFIHGGEGGAGRPDRSLHSPPSRLPFDALARAHPGLQEPISTQPAGLPAGARSSGKPRHPQVPLKLPPDESRESRQAAGPLLHSPLPAGRSHGLPSSQGQRDPFSLLQGPHIPYSTAGFSHERGG
uniref:Uncharacterized protein n=1 Tax=Myotis myotis TaxID=51298 RepID=A0A7J7VHW9_MYOMY|nr:hypothetical protein mMyoMyo1_008231 [Myotis myotis]